MADRFKSQPISFTSPEQPAKEEPTNQSFSLAQSKSTANVLDRDEDGKTRSIFHKPVYRTHLEYRLNFESILFLKVRFFVIWLGKGM